MVDRLTVALVHDVFDGAHADDRLRRRLTDAAAAGAALAVLPELPLDAWAPAAREPSDDDAEAPGGRRHRALEHASSSAGIAVLGGAIVRDERSGERRNRALVFDAAGCLSATYDKLHLPNEPGFWEREHYRPGDELPRPVDVAGLPVAVQLCSDAQRHAPAQAAAALGALAILHPRATPDTSWDRWRAILRALALSTSTWVVSVNRPRADGRGVAGPAMGPSAVIRPDGDVVVETHDPLTIVKLDREAVESARRDYPGYLAVRADLYAAAWSAVAAARRGRS